MTHASVDAKTEQEGWRSKKTEQEKKKNSKENESSALARKFRKRNRNSILPPF